MALVARYQRPRAVVVTPDGTELVLVETPSIDNTYVTTAGIAALATGAGSFAYIVPAGSTQIGATPIVALTSVAVSGAADTGVRLDVSAPSGTKRQFINRSGSEKLVWPGSGDQIESEAVDASVPVADGGNATFVKDDTNIWYAT